MNHLWRVNEVEIRKFDIGLMDFESPLNALQLWTRNEAIVSELMQPLNESLASK